MLIAFAAQDEPRFLHRADPAYWHPAYEALLGQSRFPLRPLGDFITHITYGPIITGRERPRAPGGIALVNQGQVGEAGVNLDEAIIVPEGCAWDLPRARLQPGDLVICRSGTGSVARNRLAVYLEEQPAAVGSFVDLVRVDGLDPVYAALYLKTALGWSQIHRLINGVATPNLSFEEIRGVQVACAPEHLQNAMRQAYLDEVWPLHRARAARASSAFRHLVQRLEQQLIR